MYAACSLKHAVQLAETQVMHLKTALQGWRRSQFTCFTRTQVQILTHICKNAVQLAETQVIYIHIIYIYVYLCICMYVCMYVYMYVYIYVCMYVCIYIYIYVCNLETTLHVESVLICADQHQLHVC